MARVHVTQAARASKTERTCRTCGKTIKPGDKFYWAKPRMSPKGPGRKVYWCAEHYPKPWDSALCRNPTVAMWLEGQNRIEVALGNIGAPETQEDAHTDDYEAVASDAAELLREIGQEYEDKAENMESGFGHATYQSDELREKGEALTSLADDMESIDWPDQDSYINMSDDEDEATWDADGWHEACCEAVTDKLYEADV